MFHNRIASIRLVRSMSVGNSHFCVTKVATFADIPNLFMINFRFTPYYER